MAFTQNAYAKNSDSYENRGKENTKQWNKLKTLHNKVKDASEEEGFEVAFDKLKKTGETVTAKRSRLLQF